MNPTPESTAAKKAAIIERQRLQGVVRNLNNAALFAESIKADGKAIHFDLFLDINDAREKAERLLEAIPVKGPYVRSRKK